MTMRDPNVSFIMSLILNSFICLHFCTVLALARSGQQVSWLPCQLVEEHVSLNEEGHNETRFHNREAGLQFGHAGDHPLNPHAITFLVTGSRVDLSGHLEGSGDQLQCELRRLLPEEPQVWAGPGAREDDLWFTCTLRHDDGLFLLTSVLRHTPTTPSAQADRHSWPPIGDRDTLVTTAAMLLLTRSPAVHAGLSTEPRLDCRYAVDHRAPELSLEWRLQRRGERSVLFRHAGQSGLTQGSGVALRALAAGDASLSLPLTRLASEGTYTCSVSVAPLHISLDVTLTISEPPRVSLNVDSTVSLVEGGETKLVCEASGYYPLDVDMEWMREPRGRGLLPERLQNVLFSSHRHHQDGTYTLSAFFLLRPRLQDSGSLYFCRVSHASLRMPIRKSFTLNVTEEPSWWPVLGLGFVVLMVALLCVLLPYLHSVRQDAAKKRYKPY